jgi:hypothetical protein
MTEPITTLTASAIATLAFQEFIKSGTGELAKKFTGGAISKMTELRKLIWDVLRGNSDAESAMTNVENGKEADLTDIGTYLKVAMSRDQEFAQRVRAISHEINSGKLPNQNLIAEGRNITIQGTVEDSFINTGDNNRFEGM